MMLVIRDVILFSIYFLFISDSKTIKGRCRQVTDIVVMVPAHHDNVSVENFQDFYPLESFLQSVMNHFEIDERLFNIGLIMFNRLPVIVNELRPFKDRKQINTRISLMANTSPYRKELGGRTKIHRALSVMTDIFNRRRRYQNGGKVTKIGILFVNSHVGNEDLVIRAAEDAKRSGVILYVITTNLSRKKKKVVQKIASGSCRVFEINNFENKAANQTIVDLGNSICTGNIRFFFANRSLKV